MSTLSFYKKACMSLLGCAFFLSGTQSAVAAALNISNIPLILSETVAPNLILTLDDSGSMRASYVPDSIESDRTSRRIKSSTYNSMYYNPEITYLIPVKFDSNGNESGAYSTSFSEAYYNGFNPSLGGLNLNNNYKVSWWYKPTVAHGTNFDANVPDYSYRQFAENPAQDFKFLVTLSLTGTQSTSIKNENFGSITVRRSNTGCTASSSLYSNIQCSRSNSNYTISLEKSGVPAYYYVYDPTLDSCSQSISSDNCYRKVDVTGDAQKQNFAIWYSFYRNRALATLSAARLAFSDLSPSARLTWQSLNACTSLNGTSAGCGGDNRFREFTASQRGRLFSWFDTLNFNSGTPLRGALDRAGKFLTTETAWHKYPNDTSQNNVTGNTYACRPSYHISMTDGIWNGDTVTSGRTTTDSDAVRGNADNTTQTLPDGSTYTVAAPFKDGTANTLADLAFKYWATDAKPGLDNKLKPFIPFANPNRETQYWDPRNNPATWQNLVNFTMGLGLTRALNNPSLPWAGNTFSGTGYENLKTGTPWPPAAADSDNNVYDLWHAAINSRGEFFSVDSPDTMVEAFQDILKRISARTTAAARPAVSASFVSDSDGSALQSNVYATEFSSEDWSGQITKTSIDGSGTQTVAWDAKANNQSALSNVKMKSATDTSSGLQDFTWNNLTEAQQAMFNKNPEELTHPVDARGAERLAYIKGSRGNEGSAETHFRQRSTVIGDIINSSPVIVGTPSYLAYLADKIENPATAESPNGRDSYRSYSTFRAEHRKRTAATPVDEGRQEMIYVGANDGMLHGINANTGNIQFSFVPSAVMPDLYRLTGKNYKGGEHRFFVDGTPVVRDVYFDDTLGWRTVLVGTLRAGGKALFALDVTDPANIKLLWEFDATEAGGDVDLGYTFAQPEIARLHTGKWAVLMGNGYNSTNDKAALMIIDIQTGALLKKLVVPEITQGSGASATTLPNGLSSVRAADNNSDGLADYAYAGDLQGNLWRFDLVKSVSSTPENPISDPFSRTVQTNVTTDHFTIAYGGKPLFTARDSGGTDANPSARQAITIQPSLVRHPTRLGYLVLFGTGKYFETSDANVDTSRVMTLYGIWDRKTKAQDTTESTATAEKRSTLATQRFTNQHDGATVGVEGNQAVNDIRILSQEPISWYNAPAAGETLDYEDDSNVAKWGWALDLKVGNTQLGEMIVNNMSASGGTLFYSSLTPNIDPCADGADTWFYAVDAYTGGRTKYNVLDLSKDGIVNATDAFSSNVVSGVRFPALGGFNLAPGNKVFGSDGANNPATVGDDPNSNGRQSWHIIPEEFK
ncbi:PilC/PilY family type IV pilus protein [Pseudomonas sp.]|uniref:pilus assembly protein n=1 Tax=Pseudomonas sp. TaxID=306 RepID=UPI0023566610|nr:PilC/PilY family type IV pilus protein [Pseudomonas sp.]